MKKRNGNILVNLLILEYAFLIIGCESENEIIPEYVGNWDERYYHHLELGETTFKETIDRWNILDDGSIEKLNTIKGDIIVDDDSIFFIINKVTIETYYPADSSIIVSGYDRGTEKFYEKYGEGFSSYRFAVGDDIFALYDKEPYGYKVTVFKRVVNIYY